MVLPGAACEDKEAVAFVIEAAKKGLPVYAVDYVAEHDTYGNKLSEEFGKSVEKTSLAELSRCVREKCIGYGKLIATETTESANAFHDIRLYQTAQRRCESRD